MSAVSQMEGQKTARSISLVITVAILGVSSGCATLVCLPDLKQNVTISSRPAGASVTITAAKVHPLARGIEPGDQFMLSTPGQITLRRIEAYDISIAKQGYKTAGFQVRGKMNPWYMGNALLVPAFGAGILTAIIDLNTGASWTLDPRSISIDLEPL